MKYERCVFGELCVKNDNLERGFLYEGVTSEVDCSSSEDLANLLFLAEKDSSLSVPLNFDSTIRDGMFNGGQLFAVYEKHDIQGLIYKLVKSLGDLC
jgi:hypothetical protein